MVSMRRSDPPTPKQIEGFQLVVIHRGAYAAARATGKSEHGIREAARGCIKRTRWDRDVPR